MVRRVLIGALFALLVGAPAAHADLRSLEAACVHRYAGDGKRLPFTFCDDGVPAAGGTTPDPGAALALAVPERYGGDGYKGLPRKAPAETGSGADANGNVALDADLSIPAGRAPRRGFPLMVLMHTCCAGDKHNFEASSVDASGELWHYSNAWYASRGYAVLTYTSRGFVDSGGHGSTGQTQLDSRRYEVNDLQALACQLAAARDLDSTQYGRQRIDPSRVVVSGGSYGGGLAWMALTDPTWSCGTEGRRDIRMRLAAVAPRYGWSDLVYSLLPNGSQASSTNPIGVPRDSLITALYGTGKTGQPPSESHVTFTPDVDHAVACFESTSPYEQNPLCTGTGVIPGVLDAFLRDRSAYYQTSFFTGLGRRTIRPVPVFGAGSLTSPLFTQVEHRRMADRLRAAYPRYPMQEYYGDFGDFTQSKAKEWGDLCGPDFHVCRITDYPHGNLNANPRGLRRRGVTSRLNAFVDRFARPPGDSRRPRPPFDVTVALQVCPADASAAFPADQPGQRFTARSFGALAPRRLRLTAAGTHVTSNRVIPNPHGADADPIANFVARGARCPLDTAPAGAGVAVYDFAPLTRDAVMIGRPRVSVPYTSTGSDLQLDARLYQVLGDGSQVLVDRGTRRLTAPGGTAVLDLQGNGWPFHRGDRLRLELTQDDEPYLKASTVPSSLTLTGASVVLPIR
ncbi:MAG: hypothetical protein E6G53_10315 [Actinobacteria bacterium]|nr:MAG: hypothetical protein E6G53_10315 [Actinomycetota bacterium]